MDIISFLFILDADYKAETQYAMSKRKKLNLIEPGTEFKYFKGKLNITLKAKRWQCSQQNKIVGRCNAVALVKTIDGKEMVAFVGKHKH